MDDQIHISAIISEYNPFHNGHAYHIQQTRKMGATHIVAVMSGNYVQRGSCALLTKWARAEMALRGGADLVIELPLPWAVATAQQFASGAVTLIHSMGCIQSISFGSEYGKEDLLKQAADAIDSPKIQEPLRAELQRGISYATARDRAIIQCFGEEIASLLRSPNNILGVEYLRALAQLKSEIYPLVIPRKGVKHDDTLTNNQFASASYLRQLMLSGETEKAKAFMPKSASEIYDREVLAGRAPVDLQKMERAILAKLRTMRAEDFSCVPDVKEGLEYRIVAAIKKSCSLEDVYTNIKSKRYTHARIRRIILLSYLGLEQSQIPVHLPYIRVLGLNARGIEILRQMRTCSALPVVQRNKDFNHLSDQARDVYDLEGRASDLFGLAMPQIAPCGEDKTTEIICV